MPLAARIEELPSVRRALLAWHRRHGLPAPWRESGDPYRCLVAGVMAQQTQMSRVMPAYARFLGRFPDVRALARASAGEVIRAWAGMGYNQRAVRLHAAARAIVRDGWPRDAAALARIGGVGPCTASVVASFAFGEPAACVDTNVRRVLGRLAGAESLPAAAMQRLAADALSRRSPGRWNQALMDYGALVCTPRPRCDACVLARWCRSRRRYAATPARTMPSRRQGAFTGSTRYYRGRIIGALRELPPGASMDVRALRARIADRGDAPTAGEVRGLVRGLAADGLVEMRRGRMALPA
jgi:A/G-specific adenine glycosylase